jgi:lysyl-tRNA synthetase class 2
MRPMASTNIMEAGYDAKTGTLRIAFMGGGTYDHYKVPEEIWAGLRSAASPGRYYAMNIKGRFQYERMD